MARKYVLKAETRDSFGKNEMHRLRKRGFVPGVVYGPGQKPLAVSVDNHELSHLLQEITFENTIIELKLSGKSRKRLQTLIREVQRHPFKPIIQHVDFFCVPEGRKVHVEIPIVLHGSPVGVRTQGGLLQHELRDLEILVLPGEIPEQIVVDITDLEIHDSIHVEDLPKGNYEVLTDPKRTVVTVVSPVVHRVAAEEVAAAEPEAAGAEEAVVQPSEAEKAVEKKETEEK